MNWFRDSERIRVLSQASLIACAAKLRTRDEFRLEILVSSKVKGKCVFRNLATSCDCGRLAARVGCGSTGGRIAGTISGGDDVAAASRGRDCGIKNSEIVSMIPNMPASDPVTQTGTCPTVSRNVRVARKFARFHSMKRAASSGKSCRGRGIR